MSEILQPLVGNLLGLEVLKDVKIGAGVNIEAGKIYVFVAGYLKVPAAANAATGKFPVMACESVDNSLGIDGAKTVTCQRGFRLFMANDGGNPVTQAHVGVSPGYLSSATTVSSNSADGPPIGQGGAPAVVSFNKQPPEGVYGRPVEVEIK